MYVKNSAQDLATTKELFLMRHAETIAINSKFELDIDRRLTDFGRNQAFLARGFIDQYTIDKVLVSPAWRTMQTAEIIFSRTQNTPEIIDSLYNASLEDVLYLISSQPSHINSLMILGHNPTIFLLALALLSEEDQELDNEYHSIKSHIFPPASCVHISFSGLKSWQDLSKNSGILKNLQNF
jgi:phosphohistidine phosphatase